MAIPTMISAIWLAPKVMAAANLYFARLNTDDDEPSALASGTEQTA
jgi:hypothetical protein